MRKKILTATTSIFISFVVVLPVFAATSSEPGVREQYKSQTEAFSGKQGADLEATDPRLIVANIVKWALSLIGTVALIYAIYGGYQIMTSRGNDEKLQSGKKTLFTAIIGIVVILSAYSITYFVSEYLLRSANPQCDQDDAWCSKGRIEIEEEGEIQEDPLGPPPAEGGTVEEWGFSE